MNSILCILGDKIGAGLTSPPLHGPDGVSCSGRGLDTVVFSPSLSLELPGGRLLSLREGPGLEAWGLLRSLLLCLGLCGGRGLLGMSLSLVLLVVLLGVLGVLGLLGLRGGLCSRLTGDGLCAGGGWAERDIITLPGE